RTRNRRRPRSRPRPGRGRTSRDLAVRLRGAPIRLGRRRGGVGRRRRGEVLVGHLVGAALPPAVVGLVEPAALEDDAHRREDLAELAAAVRALGQRLVGERLDRFQVLATAVAAVLVGGHGYLGR